MALSAWNADSCLCEPTRRGGEVRSNYARAALDELLEASIAYNGVTAFWARQVAVSLERRRPALMAEPASGYACRHLAIPLREAPECYVAVAVLFETLGGWCHRTWRRFDGDEFDRSLWSADDWTLFAEFLEGREPVAYCVYASPADVVPEGHALSSGRSYAAGDRLKSLLPSRALLEDAIDSHGSAPYLWVC